MVDIPFYCAHTPIGAPGAECTGGILLAALDTLSKAWTPACAGVTNIDPGLRQVINVSAIWCVIVGFGTY